MGIKDRKEREKEEMRKLIIDAANDIIHEEGIEKLSIRKITNRIEYSPAIIYHYFKDKEDIINCVMKTGYEKILNALKTVEDLDANPEEKFEKSLRAYIKVALEMPEEYKNILLNSSKEVLGHTSVLFKGASKKRHALAILYQYIKDVLKDQYVSDTKIEILTQLVFTSTFGLIIRILVEKDIQKQQQESLIDNHVKFMISGIQLLKD